MENRLYQLVKLAWEQLFQFLKYPREIYDIYPFYLNLKNYMTLFQYADEIEL